MTPSSLPARPFRPSAGLTWALTGLTASVVPAALSRGNVPVALLAVLAVGVSAAPPLLRRRRVAVPWILELLIALQLCLHTFWGVWLRYYDAFWWYDKLLHVHGTLVVSFVGFLWMYALHAAGRVRLSGPLLGLFTVVFGNALGAWWEIAEFVVDRTLGKNTQYGLDNTMWDLINNLVGSLLAAGLAGWYVRSADRSERRRRAESIARGLPAPLSGPVPGSPS